MTRLFISYAQTSEHLRLSLEKHLSVLRKSGYIDTWVFQKTEECAQATAIADAFLQARVVVFLINAEWLRSGYPEGLEFQLALKRSRQGEIALIPVITDSSEWTHSIPEGAAAILGSNRTITEDPADADALPGYIATEIKSAIRKLSGSEDDGDSNLSPDAELLEALRRRVMNASEARDFRILLFDVNQFKLDHPANTGIAEIERMVKNGLAYETQTTTAYGQHRSGKNLRPAVKVRQALLIGLIFLITLSLVAWKYLL